MEFDEIKDLIDIMNQNDLSELEIEKEGLKVRLKKNKAEIVALHTPIPAAPVSNLPVQAADSSKEKVEEPPAGSRLVAIMSPIVGTFYEAPSPDANPYVEIGDIVEPDTVVCIVEAMKVMNEIKAESEGRLVEKLVASGEPVEFGQTLFLIDPNV